jgi:hypothetical protein
MKALTVRGVDPKLARALQRESSHRGASLNATVLDLLRRALGIDADEARSNGLGRLAGTWSEAEASEFEANTRMFNNVDSELWR